MREDTRGLQSYGWDNFMAMDPQEAIGNADNYGKLVFTFCQDSANPLYHCLNPLSLHLSLLFTRANLD